MSPVNKSVVKQIWGILSFIKLGSFVQNSLSASVGVFQVSGGRQNPESIVQQTQLPETAELPVWFGSLLPEWCSAEALWGTCWNVPGGVRKQVCGVHIGALEGQVA